MEEVYEAMVESIKDSDNVLVNGVRFYRADLVEIDIEALKKKTLLHFEKRLKVDRRIKKERNNQLTLRGKGEVKLMLDVIDYLLEQEIIRSK